MANLQINNSMKKCIDTSIHFIIDLHCVIHLCIGRFVDLYICRFHSYLSQSVVMSVCPWLASSRPRFGLAMP